MNMFYKSPFAEILLAPFIRKEFAQRRGDAETAEVCA